MIACQTRLPRRIRLGAWGEADQDRWSAACRDGSVLDEKGLGADWSVATKRKVEHACGHFLGFVVDQLQLPLQPIPRLATRQTLLHYVDWLGPRVAPATRLGLIADLEKYIRVAWPEVSRCELKNLHSALRWRCAPTRDKRSRVVSSERLFKLGEHLMATTDDAGSDVRWRLARYRDGLVVAFLALMPLRLRALSSLQLGEHIVRDGGWSIDIPAELSKTKRPWEASVPNRLRPALDRYVGEVRPALLQCRGRWYKPPGRAFWISTDGSAFSSRGLYDRITLKTAAAFGRAINPHLFRDCATTTLARSHPGEIGLAPPLLGHASSQVTTKYYNQASSVDAGRRHIEVLRALRRGQRRRSKRVTT